jgi:hypothetical protein
VIIRFKAANSKIELQILAAWTTGKGSNLINNTPAGL